MFHRCCATVAILLCCCVHAWAEETRLVAGRTIDDYVSQLSDDDRVVRLRAIRSLGVFGADAGEELAEGLTHEDAAVRDLAAVSLGQVGGASLESAKTQLGKLAKDDTSRAVRMAASYSLCRAGLIDEHLPFLVETLAYPERGTACSAAELIGRIGPDAAAAIAPLEAAYSKHRPGAKGGDYHIGGAALNALRKLRPAQD